MNLDDLDKVIMLRNHRAKGLETLRQARSGLFILTVGWDKIDVSSVVCVDPIRAAAVQAVEEFIDAKEAELAALGVVIPLPVSA